MQANGTHQRLKEGGGLEVESRQQSESCVAEVLEVSAADERGGDDPGASTPEDSAEPQSPEDEQQQADGPQITDSYVSALPSAPSAEPDLASPHGPATTNGAERGAQEGAAAVASAPAEPAAPGNGSAASGAEEAVPKVSLPEEADAATSLSSPRSPTAGDSGPSGAESRGPVSAVDAESTAEVAASSDAPAAEVRCLPREAGLALLHFSLGMARNCWWRQSSAALHFTTSDVDLICLLLRHQCSSGSCAGELALKSLVDDGNGPSINVLHRVLLLQHPVSNHA